MQQVGSSCISVGEQAVSCGWGAVEVNFIRDFFFFKERNNGIWSLHLGQLG